MNSCKTSSSRQGILLCLVGPAGSGKSTIAKSLIEKFAPALQRSISVTTRKPREGEINGVHYHFITLEEFQLWEKEGRFFEWEETHGNRYGTLKSTIESAIVEGRDLLFDIDIRGAFTLKRSFPTNAVSIFFLPPNLSDLEARIRGRSAVTEEELKKRLSTATREISQFLGATDGEIDYLLINDSLELTVQSTISIYNCELRKVVRLNKDNLKSTYSFGE